MTVTSSTDLSSANSGKKRGRYPYTYTSSCTHARADTKFGTLAKRFGKKKPDFRLMSESSMLAGFSMMKEVRLKELLITLACSLLNPFLLALTLTPTSSPFIVRFPSLLTCLQSALEVVVQCQMIFSHFDKRLDSPSDDRTAFADLRTGASAKVEKVCSSSLASVDKDNHNTAALRTNAREHLGDPAIQCRARRLFCWRS